MASKNARVHTAVSLAWQCMQLQRSKCFVKICVHQLKNEVEQRLKRHTWSWHLGFLVILVLVIATEIYIYITQIR